MWSVSVPGTLGRITEHHGERSRGLDFELLTRAASRCSCHLVAKIHILSFLASCSGGGEARFAFHQFFSELTQCQVFSIQSPLGLTKSSGMLLIICCRNQNGLLPLLMINCFLSSPSPADLPWKTADGGGQVIIAVCSLMMISLCFRIVLGDLQSFTHLLLNR